MFYTNRLCGILMCSFYMCTNIGKWRKPDVVRVECLFQPLFHHAPSSQPTRQKRMNNQHEETTNLILTLPKILPIQLMGYEQASCNQFHHNGQTAANHPYPSALESQLIHPYRF